MGQRIAKKSGDGVGREETEVAPLALVCSKKSALFLVSFTSISCFSLHDTIWQVYDTSINFTWILFFLIASSSSWSWMKQVPPGKGGILIDRYRDNLQSCEDSNSLRYLAAYLSILHH